MKTWISNLFPQVCIGVILLRLFSHSKTISLREYAVSTKTYHCIYVTVCFRRLNHALIQNIIMNIQHHNDFNDDSDDLYDDMDEVGNTL